MAIPIGNSTFSGYSDTVTAANGLVGGHHRQYHQWLAFPYRRRDVGGCMDQQRKVQVQVLRSRESLQTARGFFLLGEKNPTKRSPQHFHITRIL
ncbi:hypothetical protein Q3G72_024177 [Acer saccharum]|nr:hypothetical protein Q3G72_024177 [Acer saccharum]